VPMESVVTLLVAVEDFVEEPGPPIVKPAVDLPPRSESSHPSLGPGRGRETTGIAAVSALLPMSARPRRSWAGYAWQLRMAGAV
jgi:hypothetical protein